MSEGWDGFRIIGENYGQWTRCFTKAIQQCPEEAKPVLRGILRSTAGQFGLRRQYEMLNGLTVRELIAKYATPVVEPLASGERDGLKYAMYAPPPPPPETPPAS